MLCPSRDAPLSEGEKLPFAHGILLQFRQSGTLLQKKLVVKVTLNIFLITCLHHVPENPVLYEIQGPDVISGWSHTGFFKLVTKHSSENETILGESSVGSTLILKFN